MWFIRQFLIFRMSKDIIRNKESLNFPENIAKKLNEFMQAWIEISYQIFHQPDGQQILENSGFVVPELIVGSDE